MIGGGINSLRAAVANNVARTANFFSNDAVKNKLVVGEDGGLTLLTGVPKESFKEKVANGALDWGTILLSVAGGPEGALTAQGGKSPAVKGFEEVKDAVKTSSIASQRQGAVRKAWKEEQSMVERTAGRGTRRWNSAQLKELKETGKVKGMKGHHINNVKHHPEMAGDPNNIEFVTTKEHLLRHNGNFRNKTTGTLKNRKD